MGDLPPDITRQPLGRGPVGAILAESGGLREQLRSIEAGIIFRAVGECGGDRRAAAQRLGIGVSSLYRKLEELAEFEPLRGA
jgi:two-component system response regulator AtoC